MTVVLELSNTAFLTSPIFTQSDPYCVPQFSRSSIETRQPVERCWPHSSDSLGLTAKTCAFNGAKPDVDVGLGEGAEHGGRHPLLGGHLVAHRRQDAALVNLLHLADAAGSDGLTKPTGIASDHHHYSI